MPKKVIKKSTVQVPQVLLAFNTEKVNNILSRSTYPLEQLIEASKGFKESLLLGFNNNFRLFSLEHDTLKKKVTIKLIDPDNTFEEKYFANRLSNIISRTGDITKNRENDAWFIEGNKEKLAEKGLTPDEHILETAVNDNSVWLAYGIGEDYENWFTPSLFQVVFISLETTGEEGRSITIELVDNKINYIDKSLSIASLDYLPSQVTAYSLPFSVKQLDSIDIHETIRRLLQNFFSKLLLLDQVNIYIILPDLNKVLKKLFQDYQGDKKASIQGVVKFFNELGFEVGQINNKFISGSVNSDIKIVDEKQVVVNNQTIQRINLEKEEKVDSEFIVVFLRASTDPDNPYNIKSVVNKFIHNLSRACNKTYPLNLVYHFQKSYKIMALINKKVQGNTVKNNKPLFVFGDDNLIRDFVYGGIDLATVKFFDSKALEKIVNTKDILNIFTSIDYNQEVRELVKLPRKEDTGLTRLFHEVPDEFGISNFSQNFEKQAQELIKKNQIPVFKLGVENSNITKFTCENNQVYFASLASTYVTSKHNLSSKSIDGSPTASIWDTVTKGDLIKYVRGFANGQDTLDQNSLLTMQADIKNTLHITAEQANSVADFMVNAFTAVLKNSPDREVYLNRLKDPSPLVCNLLLLRAILSTGGYNVIIKTLPAFYLASDFNLMKYSLLLYNDPPYIGVKKNNTLVNSIHTGLYQVIGSIHKITQSEIYSEFKLVRSSRVFEKEDLQIERTPESAKEIDETINSIYGLVNITSKTVYEKLLKEKQTKLDDISNNPNNYKIIPKKDSKKSWN